VNQEIQSVLFSFFLSFLPSFLLRHQLCGIQSFHTFPRVIRLDLNISEVLNMKNTQPLQATIRSYCDRPRGGATESEILKKDQGQVRSAAPRDLK